MLQPSAGCGIASLVVFTDVLGVRTVMVDEKETDRGKGGQVGVWQPFGRCWMEDPSLPVKHERKAGVVVWVGKRRSRCGPGSGIASVGSWLLTLGAGGRLATCYSPWRLFCSTCEAFCLFLPSLATHRRVAAQVSSGFLEGILRGYKAGLLTQNQYNNLTQCETIEGMFRLGSRSN